MQADEIALQKIVDQAVGIPRFTYPMFENAPRPQGEYAAIKLERETNPGYDGVRYIERVEEGVRNLYSRTNGIRLLSFYVLFSRDDEEVIEFESAFYRQDVRGLARQLGYTLMNKEPIELKNITLETDWEIRKGIKVTMMVNRIFDTLVETIDEVEMTGTFNEGEDSHDININVGE